MKNHSLYIFFFLLFAGIGRIHAQEQVAPLGGNPKLFVEGPQANQQKKSRAALPFIEDFSYEGPYPNVAIWEDQQVYVNNTLGFHPINRGVASFDGLNEFGRPYFQSPFASGTADSLTSKGMDFSIYSPADNIHFSFFYQPQGLGFAPENSDSLFLYFKNNSNQWVRMWETRGTPLQAFQIAIVSIGDTQFFHNDFQFRFVNVASLNTNDDVWNIDYIKIDLNRNLADSIMNDVGFTEEPTSILTKYTSLPYRHFVANQTNELSAGQQLEIRNLHNQNQSISVNHKATELFSGTAISSNSLTPTTIGAKATLLQNNPSFGISYAAPNAYSKVVIQNKYFINSIGGGDRKQNDTIVRDIVFDNYFAYDDGSAEKAYFLLPAANFPSKTALEFVLNQQDTVRGLMVHFGAQLPTALGKFFSIALYRKLKGLNNSDTVLYQQDLYKVQYEPTINGFSTYAFDSPIVLSAGQYFIGITQPANFGSDSIYYGLDVNNNTNIQHLYYNVDGSWYASGVQGSVMMRPIVGQSFTPTLLPPALSEPIAISVFPNPSSDFVHIRTEAKDLEGSIFDLHGTLLRKINRNQYQISIADLAPGVYILVLKDGHENYSSHKIIRK
ncbi:MAG: T9SS type A sorting domain-containing protein [Bacteroidetes bacterium]|nr:T9SS type A sorting domain-containing protein [Bacteroidota bacterium]MBP6315788.1 T9SS type A sorting domain-containing protein [Chitinophagaceae bacterium]